MAAAAAAAAGGLDARVVAALPAGVPLEYLRGPWLLDIADVKFETDEIGRTRVLGRGASGIVFAGTYRTDPVAIKQELPVTAGDVIAWLEEATTHYHLRAEGVLTVHGALLDSDDTGALLCYIVMQRMPGSLASLVLTPGGALAGANMRRRIHWLRQAALALTYLHGRSVIHGDIKPANILLSSVDEAGAAVRVTDFGVALIRRRGAGTKTMYRGERGSMLYMDPVLFDGGSATAASDCYSWAIMAWQVLTGAVPYSAELEAAGLTSEALALDALRRHVRDTTGQRPSVAMLVERGVPRAVIDVIQRCWAADPAARPSLWGVAAALDSGLVGDQSQSLVPAAPAALAGPSPIVIAAELTAALAARNKELVVVGLKLLADLESDAKRVGSVQEGASVGARDALAGFADDVEVVRVGCRAMANLAVAGAAQVLVVRNGAHIAVMMAARAHSGDVDVARHACAALRYLTHVRDNAVSLVRDGAHVAVMAAARAHGFDVEVARYACAALRNLACAADNRVPLVRDGAHTAVMAAARVHTGDVEVARDACWGLQNLACASHIKVLLFRDGAHIAVMAAARAHAGDVEVAQAACGMLQNLALAADIQVPLVRDGVHTAVMAAARAHSGVVAVARAACGVLLNLSASPDCRRSLKRDGAIEFMALVSGLRPGDSEVYYPYYDLWKLLLLFLVAGGLSLFLHAVPLSNNAAYWCCRRAGPRGSASMWRRAGTPPSGQAQGIN